MWVLGRTEHRSLGPGGRHLYLQSHLTPPSFKKESIHSFIYFFFQQKLTDHLLCASTVLDVGTREITVQENSQLTYVLNQPQSLRVAVGKAMGCPD